MIMKRQYLCFIIAALVILTGSCAGPPARYSESGALPEIFPDYREVVIPVNIAPLNFRVEGRPEKIRVIIEGSESGKTRLKGRDRISIRQAEWKKLLESNRGKSLIVTLFSRTPAGWSRHLPFAVHIADSTVDPYIVYRRIAPGYETWSRMGIYQRNLASYSERTIIDNRLLPGDCMNCHSFSRNNPDRMLLHLRGTVTGTLLVIDGEASKLNTRVEETVSHGVYPYWHPSGNYIAFSVNVISQMFHSRKEKRIEVMDSKSDLVIYDVINNRLTSTDLISSEESFETFPAFSPDGRSLVFCSAEKREVPDDYDKIKYSLCRISFDPETGYPGETIDTLVSSYTTGKSVSYPRISPDGKYLVFTLSDYGNFSIWHREADLWQLDMSTGEYKPAAALNSNEAESYHSWSSCSRWLLFSSRRADGLYTHPYLAYIGEDGNFRKPFLLPQRNPEYYDMSLTSFNVPEFVTGKVKANGRTMFRAIGSSGKNVNFEAKE